MNRHAITLILLSALLLAPMLFAQPGDATKKDAKPGGPPPGGPGGGPPPFGPGGPGGFGGPMAPERQLVKQFDKDNDGRLNKEERLAAREAIKKERAAGGGRPGFGPPGGMRFGGPGGRENQEPPKPGPKVAPEEVKSYPNFPLYDPAVLRTVFLEFEDADWEAALADFYRTDVEIPATLTLDGKKYPNVGVSFRGASSYFTVGQGFKRSLNVSVDFVNDKQRVRGYKTLNLLNGHDDPSFLHTALYAHIARHYIPTPKANLVKVVINGESWGIYTNAQQYDRVFTSENYRTSKGTRWKVKGSPGGGGGLEYSGENVEDYKRRFELKSDEDAKAWKDLITLCRTLNKTPLDQLEEALKPMLDIEGVLWFLALENAFINNDGYWIRASDYSIYRSDKGKFHIIPHDMNEVFGPGMGPGFGGFARGMGNLGMFLGRPALEATDANKDAKVSKEEFLAAAKRLFEECDSAKKGELDEKALTDGLNRLLPARPAFGGPPGGPGGGRPPGGPGGGPPPGGPGGPPPGGPGGQPPGAPGAGPFPSPSSALAAAIVKRANIDKDGKLTLARFNTLADALFTECDKDKNGALDQAEFTAGFSVLMPTPPGPNPDRLVVVGPGPSEKPGAGPRPAGPGGSGMEIDPLIGLDDVRKPLRSRLLAVPSLKARYLQHMHTLATDWLDWNKLQPIVAQYRALIDKEVEADTRKLSTFEAYKRTVGDASVGEPGGPGRRGPGMSLKVFAEERRKFLLNHPEIKKAVAEKTAPAATGKAGGE